MLTPAAQVSLVIHEHVSFNCLLNNIPCYMYVHVHVTCTCTHKVRTSIKYVQVSVAVSPGTVHEVHVCACFSALA